MAQSPQRVRRGKKLGWFTAAKCPVDAETKEWLEGSFNWLIDDLGEETLRSVEVALPTAEYFPDPYSGSQHDIQSMVERVCEYMSVDPAEVELKFFTHDQGAGLHPLAAVEGRAHDLGTYQRRGGKYHISLETSQAVNPEAMIATIAHELGHVILEGEGRLDDGHPDHEPLTDLLTVFYGMGIFNANSAFLFEQWTNAQAQGWHAAAGGYLTEEMYGYALALFAYARGESKPDWAGHLKTNPRYFFRQGLKYLEKTGDTKVRKLAPEGS